MTGWGPCEFVLSKQPVQPSATYYSLGEKIEGNVMEIEFKTEYKATKSHFSERKTK